MVMYHDHFERLQAELERMLQGAFGATGPAGVYPPVNVFDLGDGFVLKAEVPGLDPAEIDVTVEDDAITLRGERKLGEPSADSAYHRRERQEGAFRRVVRVPGRLDPGETKADYKDGVLTVHVHKAAETRPRRIDVRVE
jgi:HSP20 family protein